MKKKNKNKKQKLKKILKREAKLNGTEKEKNLESSDTDFNNDWKNKKFKTKKEKLEFDETTNPNINEIKCTEIENIKSNINLKEFDLNCLEEEEKFKFPKTNKKNNINFKQSKSFILNIYTKNLKLKKLNLYLRKKMKKNMKAK